MSVSKLVIPTLSKHTDVFRPAISDRYSRLFLFNPQDSKYRLKDKTLFLDNVALNKEELFKLGKNHEVNKHITENTLIYGIFSYLYWKKGLEHNTTFEISITDISKFFEVTMGEKGFKLFEKLKTFEGIFGIITETGEAFQILKVEKNGSKLHIVSEYMHRALNMMITFSKEENKPFYFTTYAHSSLVASKNKTASLIVIELVRLFATGGRYPKTGIFNLERYVPQLRAIRLANKSNSLKNRDLKRIFTSVYRLIATKTEISNEIDELVYTKVIPTANEFHLVIKMYKNDK
ncbi:MAG TPA: hypothetical protein VNM45_13010 [Bacillus sp. (in: firmicutes)]|nr:hypothetical protein [Bacillus sp. (in: firmicutes)]